MKKILAASLLSLTATSAFSQGISLSTGMLDYSDDNKRAGFLEATYTFSEAKSFNTKIGNFFPITGAMLTEDNAAMVYAGIKADYKIGNFVISPSFAPGYYDEGDGKDLGHMLEFKSEVQLSLNLSDSSKFGFSYNHLSNASLGDKNPGANSYMFNFFKNF